ncbi:MAG: hypothetical protein WCT14_13675 [Treponemataceae bacterium]
MNPFFLPFVAAVAANSFLTFGFGLRRLVSAEGGGFPRVFAPALAVIIAGFTVWPVFAFFLAPFSLGYLEMMFLVPFSVLISTVSDKIIRSVSLGTQKQTADLSAFSAYDGLTYAAAFMILRLATSFIDALLFASGAAVGYFLCAITLHAIRERSDTEPVPRCLRGIPLMLIASGIIAILASFLASAGFLALGTHL